MSLSSAIPRIALCLALQLLPQSESLAIGDSGGGWRCGGALFAELQSGTVAQIQAALDSDLHREEQNLSWVERAWHALNPASRRAWLERTRREFLQHGNCGRGAQTLELATRSGNYDGTLYLLDSGADPTAAIEDGSTLYTRCEADIFSKKPQETPELAARRLRSYELTLKRGGDVNRLKGERSPLNQCYDTQLLALFVKYGARVEIQYLENAIRQALRNPPTESTGRHQNALARVEFFLSHGLVPTDPVLERLRESNCTAPFPEFGSICADLRRVLRVKGV